MNGRAACGVLAFVLIGCSGASQRPRATVTIPRGATFSQAVDSLSARGIIRHDGWFRLYARARGLPAALKSGIYTFHVNDSWSDVVTALKAGRGDETRFTVLEGMMAFEIAERARVWLRIPKDSFVAAVKDTALQRELGIRPNPAGVEGYMYPTTYMVPVGIKARDLVRIMTHEFIERWSPEWDGRLAQVGMTRHELVTLASIIEAEVRYRPDRSYVSAVYHNRLKRRMPLQADPTINYAYQRRLRRVWERNLQIRSPYNTYLHPGLPPGPIGQPSDSSIVAALEPAPVGFIYFVAQPDGKHVFSETYAEHLAAIRRARERRR